MRDRNYQVTNQFGLSEKSLNAKQITKLSKIFPAVQRIAPFLHVPQFGFGEMMQYLTRRFDNL